MLSQLPLQTLTVLIRFNVKTLALLLPLMVIQYLRHLLPLLILNEAVFLKLVVVHGLNLLLHGISLVTTSAHTQDAISAAHIRLLKYTKWIDTSSILPTGRKGNQSPIGTLIPV